ncbi:MAG: A24 family peptidase [Thermoguttaceae bacterium]|nr:A24 family peptidase [Thermoguttaceae bacterium]MDW8077731.1 A24 family peptidase [Thermoguttaceae bacterium]
MFALGVLCGFLLVAAYTDIRWRRIYNWITYPGTATALIFNAAASLLGRLGWVDAGQLEVWGHIGLTQSLLGFLSCGVVLVVCYVLFDIGGGDVKLLAMVGAFLGPEKGLEALLWTMVLGGALALVVAIWHVGAWRLVARAVVVAWNFLRWRHRSSLLPESSEARHLPLFLAPCALIATLIVGGPTGFPPGLSSF